MCVDYTNLNKACPKHTFPLPCIYQIVDSTSECDLLCFFDCYSRYHQIILKEQTTDLRRSLAKIVIIGN